MDKRRKWMAVVIEEALRQGVLDPTDVLRHATTTVLATDLPPALVARVLQAGIDSDTFNPHLVVGTLGAENLAEHVPLSVLWGCLDEAASVIITEHPLSNRKAGDGNDAVAAPGTVQPDDVPDIEVLEG
jgi:hypothetical protein